MMIQKIYRFLAWLSLVFAIVLGYKYFGDPQSKYYNLYSAGDDFGYNLGLVGGIAMLLLLSYPMRKRLSFMKDWGAAKFWFAFHMTLGIMGPLLILFHSKFNFRSVNAGVCLWSMIIVAGSGVLGRFAYGKIHAGLYGRKIEFAEVHNKFFEDDADTAIVINNYPKLTGVIKSYKDYALNENHGVIVSFGKLFILPYLKYQTLLFCRAKSTWTNDKKDGWVIDKEVKDLLDNHITHYINHISKLATFNVYERIFSIWHILHIPLVFALAITAIVHVYGVHFY